MDVGEMLQNYWDSYTEIDGRSAIDSYRDFQEVFKTPAGERVLTQIMKWGHICDPMLVTKKDSSIDSDRVLIALGERNILLKLLSAINIEPKPKQETIVNRVKPKK